MESLVTLQEEHVQESVTGRSGNEVTIYSDSFTGGWVNR